MVKYQISVWHQNLNIDEYYDMFGAGCVSNQWQTVDIFSSLSWFADAKYDFKLEKRSHKQP